MSPAQPLGHLVDYFVLSTKQEGVLIFNCWYGSKMHWHLRRTYPRQSLNEVKASEGFAEGDPNQSFENTAQLLAQCDLI